MQFLISTYDNGDIDWSLYDHALKSEAQYVWNLYKHGILKNIWFTEKKDAVLIVETSTQDEAVSIINNLPLVKAGLLKYLINSLLPYTGYDRIMYETDQYN